MAFLPQKWTPEPVNLGCTGTESIQTNANRVFFISAFGRPCDVFLTLWVTLGLRFVILPLENIWAAFCGFGVTLGLHCGILGLHLGTLAHFLEKGVEKGHKLTSNWPLNGTVFGTFSIFLLF